MFSDVTTIQLNGNVNRQNFRYWADSNPHWIDESHSQYPQKLNVWADIIENAIIVFMKTQMQIDMNELNE